MFKVDVQPLQRVRLDSKGQPARGRMNSLLHLSTPAAYRLFRIAH